MPPPEDPPAAAIPITPETHVAYWREFDRWSLFEREPEVDDAIDGVFVPTVGIYLSWTLNPTAANEQTWVAALDSNVMTDALALLAAKQRENARNFYGDPIDETAFFDSHQEFGASTLPVDPQRPADPHNMNGRFQWFIWAGFMDACLRKGIETDFWDITQRAILIGLLNDGLFRGRFPVSGFTADDAGRAAIRAHARAVPAVDLPGELRQRHRDARGL